MRKSNVILAALGFSVSFALLAQQPVFGEPKSEAKTTIGTEIDDTAITTKVKTALLADDYVKGLDIKVETRKGVVQLSGYVDSPEQIDKAVAITKGIKGVKNVDNKMMVKGDEASVGEKIDDSIISTKVKAALAGDESIKNSTDIAVETHEGKVQLSGYANDKAQMNRAVKVARGVEGVKNVVNKISIKR
ncbi:hyperosmotically inducible protein [Nitrosospira multiformis]|uniref:Osmotically-inducible protein Y n=1 Tax=Nitrosospira multiformis TaxID=1231 RepID=A0A2T5IFJ9_9PROT|nr:BON domain-containing protein [Nitrosospira multiformis]PTQ82573.1 hyperosmotically inducible protein [Nitrosospira multiformis]